MSEVQAIKQNPSEPFDPDLAVVETRNFERVMKLHLKRCDRPDIAKEIAETLDGLAKGFINKIV